MGSCLDVSQEVPAEHNPVHSADKILNVSVAENSKTICLIPKTSGGSGGGGEAF